MSFLAIRNISNYIILKYQKNVISSAGAGAINYSINTEPLIIDKQLLNYINTSYKYTEIIKVFGESMNLPIKDNSLIFIKYIQINKNYYHLKSINPDYEDIKVKDLVVIGKVTGVFNKI